MAAKRRTGICSAVVRHCNQHENVLWASWHNRTGLGSAEFSDAAVKKVDLVEKIHGCTRTPELGLSTKQCRASGRTIYSQPFVNILSLGQTNSKLQIATAQRGFGRSVQLISLCFLVVLLHRLKSLVLISTGQRSVVSTQWSEAIQQYPQTRAWTWQQHRSAVNSKLKSCANK